MQNIFNYIDTNRDTFLQELKTFCSQPSIAAENNGMTEMADLVHKKLLSLGATVQVVTINNSFPFLLATLKAPKNSQNKKTMLIYNHYDVQPVDPIELWQTKPFEPVIKDNKFFARGVADDKGDLLLRLQCLEIMLNQTQDLPVNYKFIIEGEEEIGSPHLVELQKQHGEFWKDCDVCLWEDGNVDLSGNPLMPLGMKGVLYVELEAAFNKDDLHSGNAALVQSPVWQLVNALNTIRDTEGNVTVQGFYDNAVVPTAAEEVIMNMKPLDKEKIKSEMGADILLKQNESKLEFLKQMYFKGTANICGIWGGYTAPLGVKTVLPNKATAKIDFRLVPWQDPDDILNKLRLHLDNNGFNDIKINCLVKLNPAKSNVDNIYVKKCLEALREVHQKDPVINISTLGSGPIYSIASIYKIPFVYIGIGYPGNNTHAPNENIRLEDYFKAMKSFVNFSYKCQEDA